MATTALEKKYQRVRDEAIDFAVKEYDCEREEAIVSFSEHDCIVDVLQPGAAGKRFVYFYEEDV